MAERRSLVQGIKSSPPLDPLLEKTFVHGGRPPNAEESTAPMPKEERREDSSSRVPLTTRVRVDFAKALKRASLERQIAGQLPNTVQDILEEALQPWLRDHGYLN